MKTQLDELDQRFAALLQEIDRERFFRAVCEYLLYISDTSPLNSIARGVLSGGMERLYKALQKAEKEVGNPADKVWGDVVRQNVGKPSEYGIPTSFWDINSLRPFVRVFHAKMQTETKKVLAGIRKVIINKKEAIIYLEEDRTKKYVIKSRGKYKKEIPQRLSILLFLKKEDRGVSAKKLAALLGVEDASGVRQEIEKLNSRFRELVFNTDIIKVNNRRREHSFALNNEAFTFEFKR